MRGLTVLQLLGSSLLLGRLARLAVAAPVSKGSSGKGCSRAAAGVRLVLVQWHRSGVLWCFPAAVLGSHTFQHRTFCEHCDGVHHESRIGLGRAQHHPLCFGQQPFKGFLSLKSFEFEKLSCCSWFGLHSYWNWLAVQPSKVSILMCRCAPAEPCIAMAGAYSFIHMPDAWRIPSASCVPRIVTMAKLLFTLLRCVHTELRNSLAHNGLQLVTVAPAVQPSKASVVTSGSVFRC